MLRKILLSVCVFVTVLAMPLIAKTALASPFDKAEDYQYQYIAPSNFRHFVYPVSISTTVGRITPDLIVADEIDGQTQITRFDNVETIGQYDSKASIVATLDYTVDEIAVAQSPSSEYLLSLSENTLRISNMANGNLGTPRIYENIIAFDAFEDSVYALRLNSSGVYSIVQILYSNFATNTVNVPSQNSKLSQLVIASNPRPENLDNLEYFVVQSATKIYYNIRKVENGQFLEQSFGTDAVPITHLTLSNNILFYADIYELNKIDLENNTTQERIFKVVLSAQLVGDNVYFIQQDSSAGWEGSRQLKSISISTFDEATPKILLESRSNQKHFFDAPTSTTSRQGKVFVADSNNNRIAILDDNTTTYIEVTANIISLAVSRLDTVYALTQTKNGSSIYIYSTTTKELINTINTTERLSQISIDAVDNLYAYSNSQLYCLQNNKLIELISYANPIYSIAVAPDQIGIYALYGNSVAYTISLSNIDNTNIEHISIGTKRPSSFSVDFNQNVFVLYNGGEIVKYDKQSVASTDITIPIVYSGSDTSIAISMSNIVTATGQQINVGDLLISHKNSNALIGINKDWATVEIPDWDNYTHPDYTSNGADSYVPNPVIRTVKATTTLFDYPTEMMSSGITIDENSRIILIDEQPNGNDVYSF
ncbi:MAG: DUF5711 family protein, partial [Firmicutes bacterium]|nr:DUF5711 family protein [Bacillota bacterium]